MFKPARSSCPRIEQIAQRITDRVKSQDRQNYGPGVVPIANPAVANDAALALSKAIASGDSKLQTSVAANLVTVKSRVSGTAGNAITLDTALSNGHIVRSAATLTGGTAATGIKITTDTAAKKLLVLWFDKQK